MIEYISISELLKHKKVIYPGQFYRNDPYKLKSNRNELLGDLENIFGKNHSIPVLYESPSNVNIDSMFFNEISPYKYGFCLTDSNQYGTVRMLDLSIKDWDQEKEEKRVGEIHFTKAIHSCYKGNTPVFVREEYNDIFFNANHSFFKDFINKKYDFEKAGLLKHSLSPLLEINIDTAKVNYKKIFSKVWNNLKENGIIKKNKEMPTLTVNDLPLTQIRQ
jgi:hypothetical protein